MKMSNRRARKDRRSIAGQAVHSGAGYVCEALEDRRLLTGLTIVPTFAPNITSDPNAATIEGTINAAIQAYNAWFSTPITVAITFQEGGGLGGSSTLIPSYSYQSVRAALVANATTPDALAAVALLPNTVNNPVTNTPNLTLTSANARAIGLNGNLPPGTPDSIITLNTSICNLSRAFIDPTKYDLMSVTEHEIDEALGFQSALNGANNGDPTPTTAYLDDLFRYNQGGTRTFNTTLSTQAYFSIDGGVTDLARFNQKGGATILATGTAPAARRRRCRTRRARRARQRIWESNCAGSMLTAMP